MTAEPGKGEGTRFEGRVDAFIDAHQETSRIVSEMATNHLPHIFERLGNLEGRVQILLWMLGFGIPAIITAVILK